MEINWVVIVVAVLGSAGLGGVISSIVNGVNMHRSGVAGREDQRRHDIVQDRDLAWNKVVDAEKAADHADAIADNERLKRIKWQEAAARYRMQMILAGIEPAGELPIDNDKEE